MPLTGLSCFLRACPGCSRAWSPRKEGGAQAGRGCNWALQASPPSPAGVPSPCKGFPGHLSATALSLLFLPLLSKSFPLISSLAQASFFPMQPTFSGTQTTPTNSQPLHTSQLPCLFAQPRSYSDLTLTIRGEASLARLLMHKEAPAGTSGTPCSDGRPEVTCEDLSVTREKRDPGWTA